MISPRPIDEEKLGQTERLALAWHRLNCYHWDAYVGPKPEGFDSLPDYLPPRRLTGRRPLCKSYYVRPVMAMIEETIGEFPLLEFSYAQQHGGSHEDYIRWYFSIDRLMEVRCELFPKPCKPTLLWRLRQKAQQWRFR